MTCDDRTVMKIALFFIFVGISEILFLARWSVPKENRWRYDAFQWFAAATWFPIWVKFVIEQVLG